MRRITTVCLVVTTACLMGAAKKDQQTETDKQKIVGKWEVVSAERDGKPLHGQVGRAKGDVITIKWNDFGEIGVT